jgi:Fe2+ transport system protein FeoA
MLRLVPHPDSPLASERTASAASEALEMPGTTKLSALGPGQDAVIIEVKDSVHQQRLMEMGFIAGVPVRIMNSNDPAVLDLGGSRLAISRQLLDNVLVF